MKIKNLILRCYAERKDGQWTAVCVDLSLAAQDEDFKCAASKLNSMIDSYLNDAIRGVDKEYIYQLLTRKAPVSLRLKYHYVRLRLFLGSVFSDDYNDRNSKELFSKGLPLKLAH